MTAYEQDPDVVRWGLHHLFCSLSSGGSPGPYTCYDKDFSRVEYAREGYCEENYNNVENDEMIARALQEEFSRLAEAELCGFSHTLKENQQSSTLVQDRHGPPILAQDTHSPSALSQDRHDPSQGFGDGSFHEEGGNGERYNPCSRPGDISIECEDNSCLPEISDESALDGEVGKRLNQMVSIPHVPKVNGEIPTADEEISDHQRLMGRLQLYDLVELSVSGDGNCQFRSLSDQIYSSADHHEFVREQIVNQLKAHPELYEGYVPMAYDEYLEKMSKNGEWGDHVTLQAAADTGQLFEGEVSKGHSFWDKKGHSNWDRGSINLDTSPFRITGISYKLIRALKTYKCTHSSCSSATSIGLQQVNFGVKIFVLTSFKDTCYIEILPCGLKSNRVIFLSFWAEVHYNPIYPIEDLPEMKTRKKKKWWMI